MQHKQIETEGVYDWIAEIYPEHRDRIPWVRAICNVSYLLYWILVGKNIPLCQKIKKLN